MLFQLILFTGGAIAVVGAALATRLRVSPWWLLGAGCVPALVALLASSARADCTGSDLADGVFWISVLVALTLFAMLSLRGLFELIRDRTAAAWLPFLVGAGLCLATLFLSVVSAISCLE